MHYILLKKKENKKTRTHPRKKELAQENTLSTKKVSTKKELVEEKKDNGKENMLSTKKKYFFLNQEKYQSIYFQQFVDPTN